MNSRLDMAKGSKPSDTLAWNMSTPSLTDTMVQQLQQTLSAALGQPVNVLRRVRGKTNAGTRYVAQASADGYTLLFADNPTITVFPAINPSPQFDTVRDLVPVGMPNAGSMRSMAVPPSNGRWKCCPM